MAGGEGNHLLTCIVKSKQPDMQTVPVMTADNHIYISKMDIFIGVIPRKPSISSAAQA